MNLKDIKILKIDITEWLIKAIRESKQHPDKSDFVYTIEDEIIKFTLEHEDFTFYIDFDLYINDPVPVHKLFMSGSVISDCEFKNYSHISDLYPESDMIDFDDDRLEEIYKAVLSHF